MTVAELIAELLKHEGSKEVVWHEYPPLTVCRVESSDTHTVVMHE